MSCTGIPSVIAITVSIPASMASSIADAAKRAGTKIIEVLAPRSSTASAIVSKIGTPSTSWPPFFGVTEDLEALLGVGAVEADHERLVHVHDLRRLDDSSGDLVAAGDAAEDVEEDRLDVGVGGDHLERGDDRLRLRAAPGVEEVGRFA